MNPFLTLKVVETSKPHHCPGISRVEEQFICRVSFNLDTDDILKLEETRRMGHLAEETFWKWHLRWSQCLLNRHPHKKKIYTFTS